MLTDELAEVRRRPKPALAVLLSGMLAGLLLGALLPSGGSSGVAGGQTPAAKSGVGAASPRHRSRKPRHRPAHPSLPQAADALTAELATGVREAKALGGEAAAAVWFAGASKPASAGDVWAPHRMWSTSKAVVAIAALELVHERPEPQLERALRDAITRSDNCAIRRVIFDVEQRLGGSLQATVRAFERVLERAGVRLAGEPESGVTEQACVRYLEEHRGSLRGSVRAMAPQFGTAEWTVEDAISFTHALVEGVYGSAGQALLELMAQPKQPSLEALPDPHSPPPDWGAGVAFPSTWGRAWKGGWGGSQQVPPHFLAGQIVALEVDGRQIAAAALFVPKVEPPNDNPGITQAPNALQAMFVRARVGIERELGI